MGTSASCYVLMAKQTGCAAPEFAFDVVGDNTTSLSGCKHERVCSQLARRANIGFSLLAVDLDASVAETHRSTTVSLAASMDHQWVSQPTWIFNRSLSSILSEFESNEEE